MEDVVIFEDGERIRKKVGKVDKIDGEIVYFLEANSKEYMLIPLARVVRIIKGKGGG